MQRQALFRRRSRQELGNLKLHHPRATSRDVLIHDDLPLGASDCTGYGDPVAYLMRAIPGGIHLGIADLAQGRAIGTEKFE